MTTHVTPIQYPDGEIFQKRTVSLDEAATGFHVHGEGDKLLYFRVSLSRLLHGENGLLLENQTEVDAAMNLLWDKIAALGSILSGDFWFTRIDLVWQFRGDTSSFVRAHRLCRHPLIRADFVCYGPRSCALKGKEMRISIYDKTRERFKYDGDVVRIEIKLSGDRLKQFLGQGEKVTSLNFDACYDAYRDIMRGFQPAAMPIVKSRASFLAIAERADWNFNGVSAFELYTAGMSSRQIFRLRKDMQGLCPSVFEIDWSELLPADEPPPPVELFPPSTP